MSYRFEIGSITSGYRTIRDGSKYDKYFTKPDAQDRIIIEDGEVEDTVDLMKRVVWKYIDDTQSIATVLQGNSTKESCSNIWNFLYHHIQYKLDQRGLEQLRRPVRSWADRETGIDCDCFSIFASSILTNLKIPHSFRITKYGGSHFQHVYVVIPNGSKTIIVDPVLSTFDYEKPFTEHKDFPMNLSGIDVAVLSGHDDDLHEVLLGMPEFDDLGDASEEQNLDVMYNYLVKTRNAIANNPGHISYIDDPQAFIKMLDYAIQYWYTDKRDEALEILSQNEAKLNLKNGFSGYEDDDDDWEDSYLGAAKKGFFKKVGNFAKKAVKTVAKAVIKFNPLTITARLGFLAAMKMNLKGMGSKLKWAYASQAQAAKKGVSASEWNRAKSALAKVEKLFVDKLQGKKSALKNAILKGKAKGLNGELHPEAYDLSGLGEPFSISAGIAAATPVIVSVVNIIKKAGLFKKGENTSTTNLMAEANAAQQGSGVSASFSEEDTEESIQAIQPMPGQSAESYAMVSSGGTAPGDQKEVMAFVKKNPVVVAVGAGAVLIGGYLLLKPKKKPSRGLSGTRARTRKSTTRSTTRKRKPAVRRTPVKRKRTIKKVTLK